MKKTKLINHQYVYINAKLGLERRPFPTTTTTKFLHVPKARQLARDVLVFDYDDENPSKYMRNKMLSVDLGRTPTIIDDEGPTEIGYRLVLVRLHRRTDHLAPFSDTPGPSVGTRDRRS